MRMKLHLLFPFVGMSAALGACATTPSRQPTAPLAEHASFRQPASADDEIPQCARACRADEVCMNTFTPAGAQCTPVPAPAPLFGFVLPFDEKTEVYCTHSSGSGSHSGLNAYWALDLASAYKYPGATVRASADGIAYVFLGADGKLCPEPPGTPETAQPSDCGYGWGNRVKILHGDGYFSYYVHLDRPLVANGAQVKKGDPIGIEGWTGAAGHRHLHWSVQKLPGTTLAEWQKHIQTYVGESVPFEFEANENGKNQVFDVTKVQCAHANIGTVPPDQQPRFKGVKKSRRRP